MEKNNDIFLAGNDALVYLAEATYKKYSTTFLGGYPFRTYVSYNQFLTPSTCMHLHTFWMTNFHFPSSVRTSWMNYFSTKKTNKNIRILYSLKYKHLNKIFFTKK